jgi:superfamily I DNA/RNA helicase
LPENVNSEGVRPVIAKGLDDIASIVDWLASRIVEIEQITQTLPSIAVLVNSEDEVTPIAKALNEALMTYNIRVVACPNGQALGQENDVRVFNVEHIKGLEFEAVFFIGIDQLAERIPELFDKYLYVGTTRAATYLGVTCAGKRFPDRIATLEPSFGDSWGASHGLDAAN